MKRHLLLGTAGHIDHGKTTLVKALTGVDTDRLAEEKRRNISIELGFAPLELGDFLLGIVDMPGHQRFVRNMLAGASGIDLAMLIVAADDGVMPQTREHLQILNYLGVPSGVVVITKSDLVEEDWLDLVEAEIQELVSGTCLQSAPIVRASAHSGMGLETLRGELSAAAERVFQDKQLLLESPFRMAIDRVFSVTGHGTVVTGSIATGRVRVGDELELQPQGTLVRVRGMHSHDQAATELGRGQRAAVNLAGVHYDQVRRGQSLAAVGHLKPSQMLSAVVDLSSELAKPLKHLANVRLHLGTEQVLAQVALLGAREIPPGQRAFIQLLNLSEPVATCWGQPLVLRRASPVETVGGGQVLQPRATKLRAGSTREVEHLHQLALPKAKQRVGAAVYLQGLQEWDPSDLVALTGVDRPQPLLQELEQQGLLVQLLGTSGSQRWIHREVLDPLGEQIEREVLAEHERSPLKPYVELSRIRQGLESQQSPAVFAAVVEHLAQADVLRLEGSSVAHASWKRPELYQKIVELYFQAKFEPPSLDDLATRLPLDLAAQQSLATSLSRAAQDVTPSKAEGRKKHQKTGAHKSASQKSTSSKGKSSAAEQRKGLQALIRLGINEGTLVDLGSEMIMHKAAVAEAKRIIAERMAGGSGATVSEIRQWLGLTRKYTLPLCQYLDSVRFTIRDGDLRMLNTRASGAG